MPTPHAAPQATSTEHLEGWLKECTEQGRAPWINPAARLEWTMIDDFRS